MQVPTADWLLSQIKTGATGKVAWGEPIPERGPGVYIVTIADTAAVDPSGLPQAEQPLWVRGQTVLYIGRTKHLSKRLSQFRRHVYGQLSPHRGGQAILKIDSPKLIWWAATFDYIAAEKALLDSFRKQVGVWPFGNRMRASRATQILN